MFDKNAKSCIVLYNINSTVFVGNDLAFQTELQNDQILEVRAPASSNMSNLRVILPKNPEDHQLTFTSVRHFLLFIFLGFVMWSIYSAISVGWGSSLGE